MFVCVCACLFVCVCVCLFVWLFVWLVGWLAGWLAGWLVICLLACLLVRVLSIAVVGASRNGLPQRLTERLTVGETRTGGAKRTLSQGSVLYES